MSVLATGVVLAQAPSPPTSQPSDPNAASTPHQRAVTKTPADEAAPSNSAADPGDSPTKHQKQALKKKKPKAPADAPNPAQ